MDKSHAEIHTRSYLNHKNVNHFKSPAQSLDLNSIELVWQR